MGMIGWLGTGLMGAPMAARLAERGLSVIAWNRTRHKAEALRGSGVEVAATPAEAVGRADLVFTMLSDYAATESALHRVEFGGKLLVQMATIAPEDSRRLAAQVEAGGGRYLEAPVLGSIPEAKAGRLIIMVGGRREDFEEVLPLLKILGGEIRLIGEVGQAAALKLALNQLIASLTAAFATSLAFVQRSGIPVETFIEVLRRSALYAPTFDKKHPRMVGGNFQNPNFPTEHLLKDIDLFLRSAKGIDSRLVSAARELYREALREHTFEDYSSVFSLIVREEGE